MGILRGSGDTEGTRSFISEKEMWFQREWFLQNAESRVQFWGLGWRGSGRYVDSAEVRGRGASAAPDPLAASLGGEFRTPWGFLLDAGGVGPGFLGKSSPWAPTDLPGCLSGLSVVAVWVCVDVGIRELLAAPTEILLLTANARRGCFHGNTGQ